MLRIALKCHALARARAKRTHNLRNGSPKGKKNRPRKCEAAPMFLMPVAGEIHAGPSRAAPAPFIPRNETKGAGCWVFEDSSEFLICMSPDSHLSLSRG